MVKVSVDFELCESNAVCMQVLPSVFEVRDDDFLYLLTDEIASEQEAQAAEAARRCPRQAISVGP